MDSAQNQLADRLKQSNNILVTVSRNPSVDQLAALLGLTLILNKMGKHAAAVFSGEVPSTIEFLKPEDTIEKNTDSLRDFIIALDKNKADKLRYKVEDNVVRIFITPYKTSISQDDLEFSQGDFNVDVVVALGVHQQDDLDQAITAHGRILHDATVACINVTPGESLGSINWTEQTASSLSELVAELGQLLGDNVLDNQIATALLTGIVAETARFSNEKTSSFTMSISAALMAAGANQQLVATKLEENGNDNDAGSGAVITPGQPPSSDNGTLDIDHDKEAVSSEDQPAPPANETPAPQEEEAPLPEPEATLPEPSFDLPSEMPKLPSEVDNGTSPSGDLPQPQLDLPADESFSPGPKLVTEPPTLGGTLTANAQTPHLDPSTDPLSQAASSQQPILTRDKADNVPSTSESNDTATTIPALTPPPEGWQPPEPPAAEPPKTDDAASQPPTAPEIPDNSAADEAPRTLADLEKSVDSPHLKGTGQLDAARDEVTKALGEATAPTPEPIQALNAQPLGDLLHIDTDPQSADTPAPEAKPDDAPPSPPRPVVSAPLAKDAPIPPVPPGLLPDEDSETNEATVSDPTAPPPVPPPLLPQQFSGPNSSTPDQPKQ